MILLRHAWAGERERWRGDDRLRPLDERGCRQALGLVETLRGLGIVRLLSSPYVRCVQTVEPLAAALGLRVEPRPELGEEKQLELGLPLLGRLDDAGMLVCTHGGLGKALAGPFSYSKAGALVLGPGLEPLRYVAPPDSSQPVSSSSAPGTTK